MNIEIAVPEGWTPGQAMATRQLLQHAFHGAWPIIAFVRADATPEQLDDIYRKVNALIQDAGLEAE